MTYRIWSIGIALIGLSSPLNVFRSTECVIGTVSKIVESAVVFQQLVKFKQLSLQEALTYFIIENCRQLLESNYRKVRFFLQRNLTKHSDTITDGCRTGTIQVRFQTTQATLLGLSADRAVPQPTILTAGRPEVSETSPGQSGSYVQSILSTVTVATKLRIAIHRSILARVLVSGE